MRFFPALISLLLRTSHTTPFSPERFLLLCARCSLQQQPTPRLLLPLSAASISARLCATLWRSMRTCLLTYVFLFHKLLSLFFSRVVSVRLRQRLRRRRQAHDRFFWTQGPTTSTSKSSQSLLSLTACFQLDVTRVPPFLFQQARCLRPRSHFEMWEIAHERLE